MSCQDFQRVVEELADGRLMDAAARDAGLAHAAVCVVCAARLMEARSLGAALKVAARAETEEAPARVRASLLAAFAEQQGDMLKEQKRDEPLPANVVALPSRRAARWWLAAGVAAAVILLSLTLSTLVRVSPDGTRQEMTKVQPVPSQTPAEVKVERAGIFVSGDVAQQNSSKKTPARTPKAARSLRHEARVEPATVAQTNNDYLPLTYLADATAMESGTVVRVELSRSALISLGVHVQPDRSDETLKADVVLGDDGVARAIRLVR